MSLGCRLGLALLSSALVCSVLGWFIYAVCYRQVPYGLAGYVAGGLAACSWYALQGPRAERCKQGHPSRYLLRQLCLSSVLFLASLVAGFLVWTLAFVCLGFWVDETTLHWAMEASVMIGSAWTARKLLRMAAPQAEPK